MFQFFRHTIGHIDTSTTHIYIYTHFFFFFTYKKLKFIINYKSTFSRKSTQPLMHEFGLVVILLLIPSFWCFFIFFIFMFI